MFSDAEEELLAAISSDLLPMRQAGAPIFTH